ncbi:MAG: phosphoribosyl transferase [Clostridiales bacterium]|nr:phosphoribosyl transferase [Clostridiales bacterium]
MYTENQVVCIAKRENNSKRKYLVINRLQGKHIPVSPNDAFKMFDETAKIIENNYKYNKLLLIGFAETATAIGAALAIKLKTYYIQTTRENIENVEYLSFSEIHSHASEQKIIKTDLDKIVRKVDRIIFVEDEITTGNTILNIINAIENAYSEKFCFSVISLLNGMNKEAIKIYKSKNINLHYLIKTEHHRYTEICEKSNINGEYNKVNISPLKIDFKTLTIKSHYINARRLTTGEYYLNSCENLWKEIISQLEIPIYEKILVLGTEEFMYPALFIAHKIENEKNTVKCHSTTRSPISVSLQKDYPLHKRYELISLYDDNRKTFLYDIDKYDKIIIITDSTNTGNIGLNSLINALDSLKNENIILIRWI